MTEENPNPEMDKKWKSYLKRRRRGKYLIVLGLFVVAVSIFLGFLPVAVAAFSGTPYVDTPWSNLFGIGVFFGIFLILCGIIARVFPNMMEGDNLWIWKMGPFDPRG